MFTRSWITVLAGIIVATIAFGPGGAVSTGFLYRESIITEKRHRAALTVERARETGKFGERE